MGSIWEVLFSIGSGVRSIRDQPTYSGPGIIDNDMGGGVGCGIVHCHCRSLDHHDVSLSSIIEGAEIMWASGRSTWILVEESLDGGTFWHSPIGDKSARVSSSGDIFIEPIL